MNPKELTKRILVSVFGIPVLFACALIGKWFFLILIDIIIVGACWEFYSLAEKSNYKPQKVLGIFVLLIISWDMHFNQGRFTGWIFLFIVFFSMVNELFKKENNQLINAAVTVLGIGYISFFTFFLLIRNINVVFINTYAQNGWLVIYIFILIWACDSGAYFIGYNFGRHKLYRKISPNKTWEGSIGGFLICISAAIGFKFFIVPFLSIVDSLVIGTIVGIAGQLSDLVESMYKRNIGVKDTSRLLPGHGGILDRFDSSMLVGPIIYSYLIIKSFLISKSIIP